MGVDSGALIRTLNRTCLDALQGAAGLCVARTNYNVEVEHWLLKLSGVRDGDLARVYRHFGVDAEALARDLGRAVDGFKTGNARTPALSPSVEALVREAWVFASVQYGAAEVRSGALLLALLAHDRLGREAREASRELAKVNADALQAALPGLVSGSAEDGTPAGPAAGAAGRAAGAAGRTPALDRYTEDLTAKARAGKIDPVIGRDGEVRQMVDVLIRRRQNNPILTGEAGVGKTAVVEGFARRVAEGDVPPALKGVAVRALDLGLLQAGAGVKGEFENRLRQVIDEVKGSPNPVILFIDEAHTMIGAGGQAGQGDAANLLKPALARGELRTIAATTWAEYKKYFEKDAALARRFQVVKVEEPTEDQAVVMMRGVAGLLEAHHGVRVLDEAVEASVRLSHRYVPDRQLPDKSVSLLDTACARVAVGRTAEPPAMEDARRRIGHLRTELAVLGRESATGSGHAERIAGATEALAGAEARLAGLEARWRRERALAEQVQALRDRVERAAGASGPGGADGAQGPPDAPGPLREELDARAAELRDLQKDAPLVPVCVDAQTVASVVAGWTGIPVGKMLADEIRTVLDLKATLQERVVGQPHALEAVARRVRTSRANLTDPRRPVGVFLLVGPSGVGKTETALALADALYGGERNVVTINMSEYQEAHTVSGLKGSPPGYVGYGEGGVLTEAVRRRPYCVVLLDEVEKAHPDVLELFFQVFDRGRLEDGEGREVDFKNTVILLTSNVGSETVVKLCADPETAPGPEGLAEALRPDLTRAFPAALLARLTVVPYYPISDEVMGRIVRIQLGRVAARMRQNHKAAFTYGDDLVAAVAGRCAEVDSGARNVDHILTRTLLPEVSREVLARMAAGEPVGGVHVTVGEGGAFRYAVTP